MSGVSSMPTSVGSPIAASYGAAVAAKKPPEIPQIPMAAVTSPPATSPLFAPKQP